MSENIFAQSRKFVLIFVAKCMLIKRGLFLKFLQCSLLTGLVLTVASAQTQTDVIELKSNGCEIDEANFSVVENAAKEKVKENSFLIVIARLGDRDKFRGINQKRLDATKYYLVSRLGFPESKIIFTQGEKVSGNGRVEFYIDGVLTHVILPKPTFSLCTECCDYFDIKPSRKINRKRNKIRDER